MGGVVDTVVKVGSLGLVDGVGDLTGADDAAAAQREGAKNSADAVLKSTEKNIDFQKWLWGEQKGLTQPWVNAGSKALNDYQSEINKPFEFEKTPGYDFRKSEGLKGIENSAAARGMQLSGRTLKNIGRWSQSFASNEFDRGYARRQDFLGRLQGLSQVGANASAGQATSGGVMGGRVGNSILGGGQAQAQMYSDLGNINAANSMSTFNTLLSLGDLGTKAFGSGMFGGEKPQ